MNVSCSMTQRSDVGEARTSGPWVLSQALYHLATALPLLVYSDVYLCLCWIGAQSLVVLYRNLMAQSLVVLYRNLMVAYSV